MTDLDGNSKTFDVSTSSRWSVLPDIEVDDETSIEAHLYQTCSGHWVHRVKQISHSFDLYAVHESVPPERITEVSVAEAALMLTNPLRPEDQEEPRFPLDILTYLHNISIDGEFSLSSDESRGAGWRDYSDGAQAESGFRFYQTVDQRKRSFDLDTARLWESSAGSCGSKPKLYRTVDRIWIRCDMLNLVSSVESYKKRVNYREVSVEVAVDWFDEHRLNHPQVLREDLDWHNTLIDAGRYIARISGGCSPLIASSSDIVAESPSAKPSSALISHEDLSEETPEFELATEQSPPLEHEPEPDNLLIFDSLNDTVRFRGADYPLPRPVFSVFLKLADSKFRQTKDDIGHTKTSGLLAKLPAELRQLIDSKSGAGGGYILKEELGIEVRILKGP